MNQYEFAYEVRDQRLLREMLGLIEAYEAKRITLTGLTRGLEATYDILHAVKEDVRKSLWEAWMPLEEVLADDVEYEYRDVIDASLQRLRGIITREAARLAAQSDGSA